MSAAVDNPFESLVVFGQLSQGASATSGGADDASSLESDVREIREGLKNLAVNESYRRYGGYAVPDIYSTTTGFPAGGLRWHRIDYVSTINVRVSEVPINAPTHLLVHMSLIHGLSTVDVLAIPLVNVGSWQHHLNMVVPNGYLRITTATVVDDFDPENLPHVFVAVIGHGAFDDEVGSTTPE